MTSTVDLADDTVGEQHDHNDHTEAPYRCGDRICATSPEGVRYLARVELIRPTDSGEFTIMAAVTEPRRYRSHLLTTVVGADGYGAAVRPAG